MSECVLAGRKDNETLWLKSDVAANKTLSLLSRCLFQELLFNIWTNPSKLFMLLSLGLLGAAAPCLHKLMSTSRQLALGLALARHPFLNGPVRPEKLTQEKEFFKKSKNKKK